MDVQKEKEIFDAYWEKEGCNADYEHKEYAWSAWQAAKAQAVPDLGELQERIAGHQYYHDEHGHMIVDMDDVVNEIIGFDSWKAQAVPEGVVLVPKEPSYKMWGGIARHLCRYAQIHDRYSPKSLKRYFDMFIGDIPAWLNAEVSDWESDHAFATADIGVFIYKAMIEAQQPSSTSDCTDET